MPQKVVVLLLALALLPSTVAVATARQATPAPQPRTLSEGAAADLLIEATLDQLDLPRTVDILALARVTLPPGVEATTGIGAHLFVVETGVLTAREYFHAPPPPPGSPPSSDVSTPYLPAGPYHEGDQFLVRSGVASPGGIANEGAIPAVALVVSLAVRNPDNPREILTGGAVVEPLAVASATLVEPLPAGGGVAPVSISISLVRASYEEGAGRGPGGELIDEAMIAIDEFIVETGARLLAVEAGALNVLIADPALLTPAGGAATQLPADARASLTPGDELFVLAPGRVATRNVARGPTSVLIVTIGPDPAATVQG
jgi:hypothetical protein